MAENRCHLPPLDLAMAKVEGSVEEERKGWEEPREREKDIKIKRRLAATLDPPTYMRPGTFDPLAHSHFNSHWDVANCNGARNEREKRPGAWTLLLSANNRTKVYDKRALEAASTLDTVAKKSSHLSTSSRFNSFPIPTVESISIPLAIHPPTTQRHILILAIVPRQPPHLDLSIRPIYLEPSSS